MDSRGVDARCTGSHSAIVKLASVSRGGAHVTAHRAGVWTPVCPRIGLELLSGSSHAPSRYRRSAGELASCGPVCGTAESPPPRAPDVARPLGSRLRRLGYCTSSLGTISASLPTPSTGLFPFGNVRRGRTFEVSGRYSACLGLEAGRGVWFWFRWGPSSRLVPHLGEIRSVVDHTAELLAVSRGLCGHGLGCWSGNKLRTYRADLPKSFHFILELRHLRRPTPRVPRGPHLQQHRSRCTATTAPGPDVLVGAQLQAEGLYSPPRSSPPTLPFIIPRYTPSCTPGRISVHATPVVPTEFKSPPNDRTSLPLRPTACPSAAARIGIYEPQAWKGAEEKLFTVPCLYALRSGSG